MIARFITVSATSRMRSPTRPAIGSPSCSNVTGCQPVRYEFSNNGIDRQIQISKMFDPNAFETAPESSPLSDQMALQTLSADYTYIGNREVLVGDVSSSNPSIELNATHWQNGAPEVSENLDQIASEVVVHNPSFDIVAVFPENADPATAIQNYGRVLTKHIEVNGLTSRNQAAAIARSEWRRLQVGLSLTTGREATISSGFPVQRDDLVPGLTLAAGDLSVCIDVEDAAIRLTEVRFELESCRETAVKVGIEPARVA